MPRTIVISAWHLNNSPAGSPIAKQKPTWEAKLSELKNQIAATKNVAQAADLWVFCVPEYFFYDHANECPYNESDKEIIRKGLAGIGHHEPLDRPGLDLLEQDADPRVGEDGEVPRQGESEGRGPRPDEVSRPPQALPAELGPGARRRRRGGNEGNRVFIQML